MARDGKRKFIRGNTATIVGHHDAIHSTTFHGDLNPLRTGVDGVLHQLLHDAGRSLHHLACGNLIYKLAWKKTNRHARIVKIAPSTGLEAPSMSHYRHGNA